MRLFLAISLFVLLAPSSWAQQAKTVLSKTDVEVGEKIMLTYLLLYNQSNDFSFSRDQSILPCEKLDKNGNFVKDTASLEILNHFKDSTLKETDKKLWTGIFEITVWDTGTFKIPEISVNFNNTDIKFPAAIFKSQLVQKQDSTELYDIKEEFTELPKELEEQVAKSKIPSYLWLIIWAVIVVIAFFIIRWMIGKKSKEDAEEKLDFQQQTIRALDELKRKELWLQGKEKEHYSEMSFLLRSYFSHCYQLNLLEKTTHETVLLLKQLKLEPSKINEIQFLLNGADLVKFAKSRPDEDHNVALLERAKTIVQNTKAIHIENVE
jgi:hypothetical protein